ncbi:MAG TPA: carboxypeptidase-like regulatory domain-containing protein, partial [Bryobacteraceae bacterium]
MLRKLSWLCFGLIIAAASVLAQTTTAEITGKVTDVSGGLVPAATVTILNTETGIKRETASNGEGVYAAPSLQPGNYRITVQKEGFRPVSRERITLVVDQVARIDFQLEVGAVTGSVEVTAAAALLEQDTSSLGQIIDGSKVTNIPLNGRSSVRLVQLTPTVLSVPSTNGQFGDVPVNTMDDSIISINGGRAKTNEVLIDGIPSTTGFVNQITTIPNIDATREFKVQSNNLSAEFGRFTGGVINISTRSGTNDLHGSVYEFLRNTDMDANEYFNQLSGNATPIFHMNQYGFAVGGPVFLPKIYKGRNRTFFFTDFQGTRWLQGQVFLGSVPTSLQRTGNFSQTFNAKGQLISIYDPASTTNDPANSGHFIRTAFPGNIIPASRIDPVAAKMINYYPNPNLPGAAFTQANNLISNAPRTIDQANQSERIDHNITDNNRLFGRFSFNRSTLGQPDTFGNPATSGVGANGRLQLYNYSGGVDDTMVLSPQTVVDLRYGFARFYWARLTRSFGFDESQLGLPASFVSQTAAPLFPVVSVAGFTGLGGGSVLHTGQDTHSLLASVSRLAGKHNMKFGVDLRLHRLNNFNLNNGGGTFSFLAAMTQGPDPNVASTTSGVGLASMLLGAASSGSVNTAAGVSIQNFYIAGYVQDDIRLTSKLTINIGLRYETETPYTEKRNILNRWAFNASNPAANSTYPNLAGALSFASSGDPTVYNWDTNNIAPRAGFAWTVLPHTVIRGGAGLFYAPFSITNSDTGFVPTAGYSATTTMLATLNGVTPNNLLSNPFPQGLVPLTRNSLGAQTYLGQGISAWDPAGVTPYALQWNADLQQGLPGNIVLDIAYAGNHGVKLNAPREFDSLNPQYLSLGTGLQTLVANPFYGTISTGTLSQPTVARRQLLLPYPQYTSVNMINDSWGNSIYHALTVKAEKRFS